MTMSISEEVSSVKYATNALGCTYTHAPSSWTCNEEVRRCCRTLELIQTPRQIKCLCFFSYRRQSSSEPQTVHIEPSGLREVWRCSSPICLPVVQFFIGYSRYRLSPSCLGRWWRKLQSRVVCHHSLECDTDALDDGQEDSASDGTVTHCASAATHCEGAASEETCDDCVPWIFFPSNALYCAV